MGHRRDSRGARTAASLTTADRMLDSVRAGDVFEIVCIEDEAARLSALRFGMAEGAVVSCVTKIPAGPVVLRSGRQEIAVGRGIARGICVRPCSECGLAVN